MLLIVFDFLYLQENIFMKVAIGIDIGGTNTKIVIADEKGNVLADQQNPTLQASAEDTPTIDDFLVKGLKDFLHSERAQAIVSSTSEISGIGIGVAGLLDRKKGIVIQSPNIPAINGLPLREKFEQGFSLPVVIENDANIYAYGEKWVGAGKDFDNFVLLTLGTGLGGGLVYKGELYEGPLEIGHMIIVPSGRYCTCGSYGCLESYASGRAIIDKAISSLEKGTESLLAKCCDGNFYKITPEVIFKTALEGDNLSREVFREVGQFLGIGIANLINILSLDAVIIGGGLIGAWDMFIDELKREVTKRAFKPLSAHVQILKSSMKKDAGSVGAAGLLFKKISASPAALSS
jgi:glucokinase